MVAQLVVLHSAVELLWVKDAHASFAGDVLAGHRRRQVRLDIFFKIEELDSEGLHGVDCLHTGPLAG